MNKNLTEVVFILDRSGSMSGLEQDTIGGFNSLIKKQKKEECEVLVSTVLFDDASEVIYNRVPIQKVELMTDRTYYVRGCTALLDAVGGAIHHIANVHKYAKEEDVPAKTLFVIITDGYENASRKYTYRKVKKMIELEKNKYDWEFIFLGANIDSFAIGGSMGIDPDMTFNSINDSEGIRHQYNAISDSISCVRKVDNISLMKNAILECMDEVTKDYIKRK